MKYAFLSIGMIMVGMFGLVFIVLFQSITVSNESEYYVLKESMEAAMLESVDWDCVRNSNPNDSNACYGSLKISEQKFVENFTRRFASSVSGNISEYEIQFYDIMEMPPKATVVIRAKTDEYVLSSDSDGEAFELVNNLTGILEGKDWNYELSKNG